MRLKKTATAIICGIQILILFILHLGNMLTIKHFEELLGKGEPLPWLTEMALSYSIFIPIIFLILLFAGKLINKQAKTETLLIILLAIELILVSLVGLAYMFPTYTIGYDLTV